MPAPRPPPPTPDQGDAGSTTPSDAGAGVAGLDRFKTGFKSLRATVIGAASPDLEEGGGQDGAEGGTGAAGTSSSATTPSWTSVLDRAKKAVVDKMGYDQVPQDPSPGDTGGEPSDASDMNDASPAWVGWAKSAASAAHKARQQAAKAAEEAQTNFTKAAEKAKSFEFGEQAKDWQSEVQKNFGRVAEAGSQAGAAFAERGKVAQSLAKDFSSKGKDQLTAGAAKAKEKAAQAKDKASAVAGAAKDKLSKAGENVGGLAALSLSPMKLAQFAGVFFVGTLLISMSFSFLPLLVIAPQKFSLLFAFGSMTMMSSFAVLKGPAGFASSLVQRKRLPFSGAYAVGLVGTLVATIHLRSFILTAFFGALQFFALLYFLASYVPGGKAVLNACGKCCRKVAGKLCSRFTSS